MNCFKKKGKRKTVASSPGAVEFEGLVGKGQGQLQPHACCCCCKANCTNRSIGVGVNGIAGIGNSGIPGSGDGGIHPTENHPSPITATPSPAEDGQFFSKTSGTLRITDTDSDRGSSPPPCYAWMTARNISSDSNATAASMGIQEDDDDLRPRETAYMPVRKDDPFYKMNHPRRGKAVIFNFDHWDNTSIPHLGLTPRLGSAKDKNDLTSTLEKLDFEVHPYESCSALDLWRILYTLRDEDHSDADCLVVAIMTHGERNTVYVRDGTQIPVNLIWETFEANKCPTLAGKPKIFIIQACRGKSFDSGTTLATPRQTVMEQTVDVTDSGAFSYVIPNSADFLVAFSCPLGHFSWRNPQLGSWFIQSICKVFDRDAYNMDLQSLFTEVARDVALNYESNTTHVHSDKKKQVTSTSSTLIRKVVFEPKERVKPLLNGNTIPDFEAMGVVPILTEENSIVSAL